MNDINTFKDDLERQLVAAAQRRIDANETLQPTQRSRSPFLLSAAACVIVGLLVVSVGVSRPTTATAQPFKITRTTESVVIQVVDLVTDPAAVINQLDQAGVQAQILPVPSDPQLVGRLGVAGSTGFIAPQTSADADGAIESIVLPKGFDGTLILEYGREAEPSEDYIMVVASPLCEEFLDHRPLELLRDIPAEPDQVRFEQVDTDGVGIVDTDPDTIPANFKLHELTALSDHSFIATYVETLENWPIHPNCE